jgi:16S rRNA (cytosine1402-N4)-methyltransferase
MFHQPVLLVETLAWLELKPGERVVDATLGSGSHSLEILKAITTPSQKGFLIGIDQDREALVEAAKRLAGFENKILLHGNFCRLKEMLAGSGFGQVDKILIDCGVSMHQLKSHRGFSYRQPQDRLDSRMDAEQAFDAELFLNQASLAELEAAFTAVDAPLSCKVSRSILEARKIKPLKSMGDFLEVLSKALPSSLKHRKTHFATQYLLGIRIAVNKELEVLSKVLPQVVEVLAPQGRCVVLTYHSAEDRIVKNIFKHYAGKCICGKVPCYCEPEAALKILTRKPVLPSPEEVRNNPAARSAKLRAVEKLLSG